MIEKVDITAGSGTPIGADLVSGSYFQYLKLLDGTSGSASPIAGDPTYGLDVDVTRLPDVNVGNWSKISTLNSGSGTFSGSSSGETIYVGGWEETTDYGEITSAVSMPDAVDLLQVLIEYSTNGVDVWGGDSDSYNGSAYSLCQGAIRLPYFRVSFSATVGIGDHEYLIQTILKKKSIQTYPYIYTSEGFNTRLLGDNDGNLKTLAVPDDDTRIARGLSTNPRSAATDTTSVSSISLLKQISYMEQIPASRVVTDGGGSLTVDGSVSISGSVSNGLIQGITNTEIRATPLVVAGSITAIAAGDNNIGNVDLASAVPAGTNLIGITSSPNETSTVYNGTTALTPKFFAISASMANSNTLVAGVAGKKIRVTSMAIMSASTVNVKFQSGAGGTNLTGYFPLVANTGFVLPDNPTGWFETTASALLNMFTSASVSLGGCGKYLEV